MKMLNKLKILRAEHLKNVHGVVLYEYQEVISDRIIDAVLQNMRITSGATEEDIKKLVRHEIGIEISRQAGKTTVVVLTVEFIMLYFPKIFGRRVYIGIFAPQIEQAKTDFDRLKEALYRSAPLWNIDSSTDKEFKEQSNSKTLVLPNGSSCYIFPVTKTSKPESKTLDLIIFEESQDLDDSIVKQQIWPMGATTNAPTVYIGTAGRYATSTGFHSLATL
jgi:phage terminase large subunit-like protein